MDWADRLKWAIEFGIPFVAGIFIGGGIFGPPEELSCWAEDCKHNSFEKCRIHKGEKFPLIKKHGICESYET